MSYTEPHLASSALICIDMQNDFTLPHAVACVPGTHAILPQVASLLNVYRRMGKLIVHVIRLYMADASNVDACRKQLVLDGASIVRPGTSGSQLVDELRPANSPTLDHSRLLRGEIQYLSDREVVIYKPRWGAFYETPLHDYLQRHGVTTLVFAGCNFPNCPRTSIYQASERDYKVVLASDAVSGLYRRGQDELSNIGVKLIATHEICLTW